MVFCTLRDVQHTCFQISFYLYLFVCLNTFSQCWGLNYIIVAAATNTFLLGSYLGIFLNLTAGLYFSVSFSFRSMKSLRLYSDPLRKLLVLPANGQYRQFPQNDAP